MGIWHRFTNWFKAAPEVGQPDSRYINVQPEPPPPGAPAPASEVSGSWLARWRPRTRRDVQLASLQAGYVEMVDLIRSIRRQLENQNDVQQKMIGVLEKLPESMDQLKGVKDIAARQSETLDLLHKQMETAATRDDHMMDSMQRFNGTLQVMDESNRASSRAMENLIEKSRETERLLTVAFQRSDRRMLLFLLLFLVVIAASLAPMIYEHAPAMLPFKSRATPPAAFTLPTATPAPVTAPALETPLEVRGGEPMTPPEPPAMEPTPPTDIPQPADDTDLLEP